MTVRFSSTAPPAVDDISLKIPPGANVGVIGRTGSGKSTLLSCLLRLNPLTDGLILVDDVDIARMPLPALRGNIAMISQDPLFFTGSVRRNLDPFAEWGDDVLQQRLVDVGLTDATGVGLDTLVSERGTNLSAGQRQLLALARALLKNPKLLLLDEATSNVDEISDHLLHATIRDKFKGSTIIQVCLEWCLNFCLAFYLVEF